MATTAKRNEIIAKAERMAKGSEQQLRPENYKRDLIMALNYYNASHDDKEKKKWFLHYIAKTDKKLAVQLNKVDEKHFRHAGILARLIEGGSELEEKEATFLANEIERIKNIVVKPVVEVSAEEKEAKAASNVISIQERMMEKAREMAGEFEGMIDDFVLEDKMFDPVKELKHYQISGPVAKLIGPIFDNIIIELEMTLTGDDAQLNEGYSHLKKTKIKKMLGLYQAIQEACKQQVQVAKATRAPRLRKEKPAGKLVEKMKFMKEFPELGIKSVLATSIINSQELWVYNTKYKKLQVYRANDAKGLSVKGTTIIGYEVTTSGSKTLRKPELVKDYATMGKRPLSAAFKALTTKQAAVNGRVNDECILLKVF